MPNKAISFIIIYPPAIYKTPVGYGNRKSNTFRRGRAPRS